jgi:hypothetical protein
MAERGRKSAASLSVVVGSIDGRPQSPADLTKAQAEIWDRTVANEAADVFKTAALQQLLKEYCRHVVSAKKLSSMIEAVEASIGSDDVLSDDDLADYDKLLKMRDRETKAIADKATKLRLTNQARYTPQAAATAAKKSGADVKPWQRVG